MTTNVTIRMDEKLKKEAEDLFNDLGMNMTTAFTIFVKQAVRQQSIPFSITKDVVSRSENQEKASDREEL